jgi:hypothetical protein
MICIYNIIIFLNLSLFIVCPTTIPNGKIISSCSRHYRVPCTYTCNTGYHNIHSSHTTVTCGSTGHWSSTATTACAATGIGYEYARTHKHTCTHIHTHSHTTQIHTNTYTRTYAHTHIQLHFKSFFTFLICKVQKYFKLLCKRPYLLIFYNLC